MKKRIFIVAIISIFLALFSGVQNTYAKYTMSGMLQMNVYIDKTPPVIAVTSNGTKEEFNHTQNEVIKRTNDVTIDTRDNIKIDYNEYYYNPTNNYFDGKTPTRFDNGKQFTDEGYYKIVAVDTSGNRTEIIILLDKSAPNVNVRFYKKGEISLLKNDDIKLNMNGGVC